MKTIGKMKPGDRGFTGVMRFLRCGESIFIEDDAVVHDTIPSTLYAGIVKDTDRCYIWFDDPSQKERIRTITDIEHQFTVTLIRCFFTDNPNVCMQ